MCCVTSEEHGTTSIQWKGSDFTDKGKCMYVKYIKLGSEQARQLNRKLY